MDRIKQAFAAKNDLLNIYFTGGYPNLNSTMEVISCLQDSGVDMIEIGMPYSDPVADGKTIQESSSIALNNGMSVDVLFDQLQNLRETISIPVILMGYLNPVLQYGLESFCAKAKEIGIDGLIIPDLPLTEYLDDYQEAFRRFGIKMIFLITPQTSLERIKKIDENTDAFIYVVSSASITGAKSGISESQLSYFDRLKSMNLKSKTMIGFGISDNSSFEKACEYADGAIIGSAFISQLKADSSKEAIENFINTIKK